jgi:threonine-phosphate decarboxylase
MPPASDYRRMTAVRVNRVQRPERPPIPIDRTHGGDAPPGVLDFSASLNPLGPPEAALAAYFRAAGEICQYPAPYPGALAARIADWVDVAPENVVVGNGSTQLIHLMARLFRWRRPAVAIPTFSEIANALTLAGGEPAAIQLCASRDWRLTVNDAAHALAGGADAILAGRPNSPTGSMPEYDEAQAIAAAAAEAGAACVFDEAFIEFAAGARSLARLAAASPNLIVLRSLTKIFAIPGLRLGFAVANPELAARMRDALEPWSVNVAAERVGAACLDNAADYIARTHALIARERAFVIGELARTARLRPFPSAANFLMLAADENAPGAFGNFMHERGIALRNLAALPGCDPHLYRIGLRSRAENLRLIEAAREFAGGNGHVSAR